MFMAWVVNEGAAVLSIVLFLYLLFSFILLFGGIYLPPFPSQSMSSNGEGWTACNRQWLPRDLLLLLILQLRNVGEKASGTKRNGSVKSWKRA